MPIERILTIDAPRHVPPSWNQLHGLACVLAGETAEEHISHGTKRWSTSLPPTERGLQVGLWLLDDERPVPDPPTDVRLGAGRYTVISVEERLVSFGNLLARSPASAVRMEHLSPTSLSVASPPAINGVRGPKRYLPLPEPVAVYRGLARRWNTHAPPPLRIPDGLVDEISVRVALAEHNIRTVLADVGSGTRPGFVGTVSYVLAGADRDHRVRSAFTALSGFAALSGVGGQTTHGLGAVRVNYTDG